MLLLPQGIDKTPFDFPSFEAVESVGGGPMWEKILIAMLTRLVRKGTFSLTFPDGQQRRFGDGTTPKVAARLTTAAAVRRIVINPELGVGEAYMDETFVIEEGTLRDFFRLMIHNRETGDMPRWWRTLDAGRRAIRRIVQYSPISRSQRNVGHHYDISTDLYDLFLSPDRMYSCAYFKTDNMSLEAAQAAKIEHIAKKLCLKPGQHVLDIGSGWGHMACQLAKTYGVRVTGIALSKSQIAAAQELARKEGLSRQVDFRYQDYREVSGRFDRIYSIGMLEHVGLPHYRTFFRKIHQCLSKDGVALVHYIGRVHGPAATSPWITKYIFPGGHTPALSEISGSIEASGLVPCDIEIWRDHYNRTLNHWWQNFEANKEAAAELYDERFVRMWRYYLNASEMTFAEAQLTVFQYQLARDKGAVPRTRDYLTKVPARSKKRAALGVKA